MVCFTKESANAINEYDYTSFGFRLGLLVFTGNAVFPEENNVFKKSRLRLTPKG